MPEKISDLLAKRRLPFSFEVFPPKTAKGTENLYQTIRTLAELDPTYVSVTYGAGGSTSKATMEIIQHVQKEMGLTGMHHFTLVNQPRERLAEIIRQMKANGIRNILALRGDPPPEMGGKFRTVEGGLEYCYELIDLIREIGGDYFSIGVAGFPQGHVDYPSKELDSRYLKIKIDHGAEFVVTQLSFDNVEYSEYLDRTAKVGVNVPIIPGVLPITDYNKLLKFCDTCGAYICQEIHDIFGPIQHDLEETVRQGTAYVMRQCEDLLRRGAPGIHFYCLNKVEPVSTVWRHLRAKHPG